MLSLFAVSKLHRDTNFIFFHIASHTVTWILALLIQPLTPRHQCSACSRPASQTGTQQCLAGFRAASHPSTIRDTDLSLFAISKPHRSTNLSPAACNKTRRDASFHFYNLASHAGTPILSFSFSQPRRDANAQPAFIQQATPGRRR